MSQATIFLAGFPTTLEPSVVNEAFNEYGDRIGEFAIEQVDEMLTTLPTLHMVHTYTVTFEDGSIIQLGLTILKEPTT